MIATYRHKNLEWVDLGSPTDEDIRQVFEKYALPATAAEELLRPSIQSKAKRYDNCLYLTLHFPTRRTGSVARESREIDFCIGKNFLITSHAAEMPNIHEFTKLFEVNSMIGASEPFEHGGHLFYHLMKHLYSSLILEVDTASARLGEIENNVFAGKEREMVLSLSEMSRMMLDFKRTIRPHASALESLLLSSKNFFSDDFSLHFKSILSEASGAYENIAGNLESVRELRDTTAVLVTTKQNEVIKILTAGVLIGVPLTVTVTLFQMESVSRPIIGRPGDFWIMVIILAIITLGILAIFKFKKWL